MCIVYIMLRIGLAEIADLDETLWRCNYYSRRHHHHQTEPLQVAWNATFMANVSYVRTCYMGNQGQT